MRTTLAVLAVGAVVSTGCGGSELSFPDDLGVENSDGFFAVSSHGNVYFDLGARFTPAAIERVEAATVERGLCPTVPTELTVDVVAETIPCPRDGRPTQMCWGIIRQPAADLLCPTAKDPARKCLRAGHSHITVLELSRWGRPGAGESKLLHELYHACGGDYWHTDAKWAEADRPVP